MLKSEVDFREDNFDNSTNIWFPDFLSIGKSVGWWSQEALAGKQRNGTGFYYGNDSGGQKNKMEWFANTGSRELGAEKKSGTKADIMSSEKDDGIKFWALHLRLFVYIIHSLKRANLA